MLDSIIIHASSLEKTAYWTGVVWSAALMVIALVLVCIWARDPVDLLDLDDLIDDGAFLGAIILAAIGAFMWPVIVAGHVVCLMVTGTRYVVQRSRDTWEHRHELRKKDKKDRMAELESRSAHWEKEAEKATAEINRLLAEDGHHSTAAT